MPPDVSPMTSSLATTSQREATVPRLPPAITVGLPVHNGETYLAQALDAWLDQTFDDFDLIVSDNASTDATEEIARAYAAEDPRIQYVRNATNVGAAANFNQVFHLARSPYFKWAAHDDIFAPTFLERCHARLEADPALVLAYSRVRLIDESTSPRHAVPERRRGATGPAGTLHAVPWRYTAPADQTSADPIVRYRSVLHHVTWCFEVFGLIRTAALRQSSLIGSYYGSDRVLLAELSLRGRFHQEPADLFFRRCHPNQSSSAGMSPRKQAQWISGRRPGSFVFPQWHLLKGYLSALGRADLTPAQRLRGTQAVWSLATRSDKVRRLFVPGPHNYFGIGAAKTLGATPRSPRASFSPNRPPEPP